MRVAINGFGRIGKLVFRAFLEKNLKDVIEVMADGVDQSEAIVRNFDKLNKTNERLAKETKFIDGSTEEITAGIIEVLTNEIKVL